MTELTLSTEKMKFVHFDSDKTTIQERKRFKAELRKHLDRNEISQKEFADSIGVSENTVGRWFNKGRFPQRKILERIILQYGIVPEGAEIRESGKTVQRINSPKMTQKGDGPKALAANYGDNSTNTAIAGGQPIIDDLRPDVIELAQLIQFAWSPMQIREKIIELRGQIDGASAGR